MSRLCNKVYLLSEVHFSTKTLENSIEFRLYFITKLPLQGESFVPLKYDIFLKPLQVSFRGIFHLPSILSFIQFDHK